MHPRGPGSFKEALQGQTCRGEQQGCAWPPLPRQACPAAAELLGETHRSSGVGGGSALGVDIRRRGRSAQSWLRAPICWRLAQLVVPEALRPPTPWPPVPLHVARKRGHWGRGQNYESHQLAKRDYCRIINPGPGMFMRL